MTVDRRRMNWQATSTQRAKHTAQLRIRQPSPSHTIEKVGDSPPMLRSFAYLSPKELPGCQLIMLLSLARYSIPHYARKKRNNITVKATINRSSYVVSVLTFLLAKDCQVSRDRETFDLSKSENCL